MKFHCFIKAIATIAFLLSQFGCSGGFDIVTFGNDKIYLTVKSEGFTNSNLPIRLKEGFHESVPIYFELSAPLPTDTKISLYQTYQSIPVGRVSYGGAVPTSFGYELTIPRETTSAAFVVSLQSEEGNSGILGDRFDIKMDANINHDEFQHLVVAYEDSESGLTRLRNGATQGGQEVLKARNLGVPGNKNVYWKRLENSEFGWDVDANQDLMLVGAPLYDNEKGAAFVFKFNRDSEEYEYCNQLESPVSTEKGQFGFSVGVMASVAPDKALKGDRLTKGPSLDTRVIAIGAPGIEDGRGRVYLYSEKKILECENKPIPPLREMAASEGKKQRLGHFGYDLDFFQTKTNRNALVVGMPGCGWLNIIYCYAEYNRGLLPLFRGSAWVFKEEQVGAFSSTSLSLLSIEVPGPGSEAYFAPQFGASVAAVDNAIVIGSPMYVSADGGVPPMLPPYSQRDPEEGAVYLVELDENESQILSSERIQIPELTGKIAWSGFKVDISKSLSSEEGYIALVGAPRADLDLFSSAGRVFGFQIIPGTASLEAYFQQEFRALPPIIGAAFGAALSISEDGQYVGVGGPLYAGVGAYHVFYPASHTHFITQDLSETAMELIAPNTSMIGRPPLPTWIGASVKALSRPKKHCQNRIQELEEELQTLSPGKKIAPECVDLIVTATKSDQEAGADNRVVGYGGLIIDERVMDANHWKENP